MSEPAASPPTGYARSHPKGLYALFFTEMWERFNFYLMIAIFGLYLTQYLGFADDRASDIQTWYLSLVYLSPFFGGLIADRLIGYRNAVVYGGLLMALGAFALAFDRADAPGHPLLYAALALLICGNGLFKPNISTMVGKLYAEDDPMRDRGFTIFYMGINIGAALAPIAASYLRDNGPRLVNSAFGTSLPDDSGWHIAFAAGGVGMLLGLVIFLAFNRLFLHINPVIGAVAESAASLPDETPRSLRLLRFAQTFNMIGIVVGFLGLVLLPQLPWLSWFPALESLPSWLTPVIVFALFWLVLELFTIGVLLNAGDTSSSNAAMLKTIFVIVALFWMAFHQNSVTLTFFARDKSAPVDGEPWPFSLLANPETYQVVNPLCVVLFSPLMVGLWSWLNRRGAEPSVTNKIAVGMLITAIAYMVMAAAGFAGADQPGEAGLVRPYWLVSTYVLLTIAELCLSPIGLSLTSKLAPARYKGLWMGFWFMATAVGNKLVHVIGQYWQREAGQPNTYPPSTLFLILVGTSVVAAVMMVVLVKLLRSYHARAARKLPVPQKPELEEYT